MSVSSPALSPRPCFQEEHMQHDLDPPVTQQDRAGKPGILQLLRGARPCSGPTRAQAGLEHGAQLAQQGRAVIRMAGGHRGTSCIQRLLKEQEMVNQRT